MGYIGISYSDKWNDHGEQSPATIEHDLELWFKHKHMVVYDSVIFLEWGLM
jgi:hypothetical protein